MIITPISYRMRKLEASNNHLLQLYYSLYSKLDEQERNRLKNEISIRIGCRERFKLELRNCMEENFPPNTNSDLKRLGNLVFSGVINFQEEVTNLLFRASWNNCYYYEIRNLRAYYDLLYSPKLKLPISNLLLKQKRCMEGYLLCPV